MNTLVIVAVVALLALNAAALWIAISRGKKTGEDEGGKTVEILLQQLNDLRRDFDSKLGENAKTMHDSLKTQLSESSKIVREVTEGLGELKQTNKKLDEGISLSTQLQHMLQNPKQRGNLGEYLLETVLRDVLPPGVFQTQYAFKNGETVDAAIFVKDKIVPVDSKSSLDNYNRMAGEHDPARRAQYEKVFINDLKLRVKETAKYIRPAEGTMDFAFMFIPSEGVYYDLLSEKIGEQNIIQRAIEEYKVIIVSPTTFLAYLQTVLQGLKSLQIEEQAKEIQKRVVDLGRHLKGYEDYHARLGKALGTVVGHYNASGTAFKKLDKDVLRITGAAPDLSEPPALDRPREE